MNHIDPSWLQSFVSIAESGALARAAEQVNRTPSALSVQLRQLESTVSARLVERTTRRLQLTAEGERFLPYARKLLELQREALEALRPAREQQVWRIGLSEYFVPARLKSLLSLLEECSQGARLEVTWARSGELQRQWSAGQLDMAVITANEPPKNAQLVRREPLAWIAAPHAHFPSGQPLPLVLLADSCPVRDMALASLRHRGVAHSIRMACSGSQAVITAIRAGWGVGCLNLSAIPPDLEILSEADPRRWKSPGRLAFYALAKGELAALPGRLKAWMR
ncbi:LysR substrate-binding domain-containing protein [Piscinibacter terrae]|uniref:LysR family transcriptional regulator n=1 Tax=Piscinibacter terrae TaxID=2496871 RepID=A0A3N7JQ81_9BURK|nr:LysR substrate-binding domain-containing protein [Albitalea terrae]RQP23199.1 LysR family transcriptional regulator [Albitalea terrae]